MVDLTTEMAGLWAALGPSPAHRGRVIQVVSPSSGEGASTVAREYARLAAVRARKPVWLVDGDLLNQGQMEALARAPERFGRMGKSAQATPDGSIFYAVTPRPQDGQGRPLHPARLLSARACLGGRLWVTRFATETLRSGQKVEALSDPRYWDALRAHADTVVIDAPAADRSDTAVTLAPLVDASVLVVGEAADPTESMALRDALEAGGGRIAGLVVNRSTYSPPSILRRLAG